MVRRLVIRLTTLCILLASVGAIGEVESPDAHMAPGDQVVCASSLVEHSAPIDSSMAQHEDHCCHGHVMADPGQTQTTGPIAPLRVTRDAPVSAESLTFSPPVRPPKLPSLQQFA